MCGQVCNFIYFVCSLLILVSSCSAVCCDCIILPFDALGETLTSALLLIFYCLFSHCSLYCRYCRIPISNKCIRSDNESDIIVCNWQLSIAASYWLVNKSGLPLIFKQDNCQAPAAGQFEEHEIARCVAPLLFCFADKEKYELYVLCLHSVIMKLKLYL